MFRTVTLAHSSRPVAGLEPTLLSATQQSYQRAFDQGEAPEPAPLAIGQVVAGKYRVERLIGAGGMGAVYAVRHAVTGKELALKCMSTEVAGSVRAVRRFVREAQAAGRIHHPNVVDVYDIGQDGSLSFILMEILHGEPLSHRLQRGPMDVGEAVSIMVPLLRGVAAAHAKGVLHRDLKPDNIFLCREPGNETLIPKVVDFGIAKILSLDGKSSTLTQSGALLGTPSYLSPEQAEGADVDVRTDLYACGVVLYRMVTGELPYRATTFAQYLLKLTQEDPIPPSERRPGVPRELGDIILRGMARDPKARYPDAESFARALATHGSGVRFSRSAALRPKVGDRPGDRAGGRGRGLLGCLDHLADHAARASGRHAQPALARSVHSESDLSTRDTTHTQAASQREEQAPAPLLALALECQRPSAGSVAWSLRGLHEVRIGRGTTRGGTEAGRRLRVETPDDTMSVDHAGLVCRETKWWIVDAGSKNGTLLNGRRVDSAALEDGDFVELGTTFFVFRESDANAWPPDARCLSADAELPSLLTLSGPLRRDFTKLSRVAQSTVPVMVLGETGTGKELVARAVHSLSGRQGEFLAVNCAALSESMVESELFGHRKGAFSGASESRPGLVRAADGGTLFLDEIGELPIKSQAKLLRVLQEGEVHPLGETRPVRVDVRMVTATHRDLAAQIGKGGFRDDFYGRLAGYEMMLLPLRSRKEDLGLLVSALLERIVGSKVAEMRLQPQAARALFMYDWPRNVRELELTLAAAAALSEDGKLRYDYLPGLLRRSISDPSLVQLEEPKDLKQTLCALFERHDGNVSAVAREMGKERLQIRRWCKRFGLDPASFRK